MNSFERENLLKQILDEIKKTDEFVHSFQDSLMKALYPVITAFFKNAVRNASIDEVLQNYGVVITNYTESVIDKDRSYPEYRLREELEVMNKLIAKLPQDSAHQSFMESVVYLVKELMIKHFPAVFDLSGNGFRLLEMNTKLYVWEFNENLTSALDN